MNTIIVDDDELSRTAMRSFVGRVQFMHLEGMYSNAQQALNTIREKKIDLMLLDIEMPEMSGLTLLKSLRKPPITILVSAKKEYALEAFEYNVVDYLVKPLSIDRFFKAAIKAKEQFDVTQQVLDLSSENYVFVKTNGELTRINMKDILYIEALGDYVNINTVNRKYTVHSSMKAIENKLDPEKFVRVHRSFIVAIDNVDSVDESGIVINKNLISVGAVYKENLSKRLSLQ